jgi:DNA replication protein DnaC
MKNAALLEDHLRSLRLPAILASYRRIAGDDADKIAFLHELAALEVDKRHENGVRARIAAAHFPVVKTMESFDFSLQPQLPKTKLLELLDGRFVTEGRNPILIGPTGVGKTHCLVAIGLAACAGRLSRPLHDGRRTLHDAHRGQTRRPTQATLGELRAIPPLADRRIRLHPVRARSDGSALPSHFATI